jgi:hypothetical protein
MTWVQAIEQVLRDNGKPMHYLDITEEIINKGYTKYVGANPPNMVMTNLSYAISKPESPFWKVEKGVYGLVRRPRTDVHVEVAQAEEPIEAAQTAEAEGAAKAAEAAEAEAAQEQKLINAYGMFWDREKVHWTSKMPRLLGEWQSGAGVTPVNFTEQVGIYLLHDGSRVIYIGQAVDQGLGARLYQHTKDRLWGRWNRFSWFGMKSVNDDGKLSDLPREGFTIAGAITAMEALLIEALEPPQNRRQGEGLKGLEYIQKPDPKVPDRALGAMQRGLVIAQDSGNRYIETHLAANLAQLEAQRGDPLAALDHFTLAIRNFHDSGNVITIHSPLQNLAVFLNRLGRHVPAATIAGFARSPFMATACPEIDTAITHLCEVLGDQTYESLAREGEAMTTAEMVTYAYDQIDQARTQLNAVSK